MTSNGSLVHDTPAHAMNEKADPSRVSEAVAAAPEAARRTGETIRRNPTPIAAAAIVLAGATAIVIRMRAMRKPPTRAQRVRAAVTTLPARVTALPSRMRRTPTTTAGKLTSKLGRRSTPSRLTWR